MRTADGVPTKCPKQASQYRDYDRSSAGHSAFEECDFGVVKVEVGDIVLLASDGVSDNLYDTELKTIVANAWFQGMSPYETSVSIVAKAIEAGRKPDDVSVVVAYVK